MKKFDFAMRFVFSVFLLTLMNPLFSVKRERNDEGGGSGPEKRALSLAIQDNSMLFAGSLLYAILDEDFIVAREILRFVADNSELLRQQLLAKNDAGMTPLMIAIQNNVEFAREILTAIKRSGERLGLISQEELAAILLNPILSNDLLQLLG